MTFLKNLKIISTDTSALLKWSLSVMGPRIRLVSRTLACAMLNWPISWLRILAKCKMSTLTLLVSTLLAHVSLVLMPMQSQAAAVDPIRSAIPFIQKEWLIFFTFSQILPLDIQESQVSRLWEIIDCGRQIEHVLQLVNISKKVPKLVILRFSREKQRIKPHKRRRKRMLRGNVHLLNDRHGLL